MSKVMLFYKNVVPLSRESNKNAKFEFKNDFSYAKDIHWTPLAGVEFYKAALDYPILFMGSKNEDKKMAYSAVALLGLSNNKNDYINADKTWKELAYVPAFVRRYPFVLAANPQQEDLSVCIDTDSGMINDIKGIELFNADGSVSPFLDERIAFLNDFKNSMEQTSEFIDMLVKMDLLIEETINVRHNNGATAKLEDFWIINPTKFDTLSGDQLHKLSKRGFLGWIFAHFMSLNNLPNLLDLRTKLAIAEKAAAEKPKK